MIELYYLAPNDEFSTYIMTSYTDWTKKSGVNPVTREG